jgi:hypothetical protein
MYQGKFGTKNTFVIISELPWADQKRTCSNDARKREKTEA